ncbi:hypothetical protein PC41400_07425 [Paenibacillus chitinolyticus]|uniref:Uncharacterized protein n=1 Tax=Paenibacillus chitinolyticus TaxID=79263 RepID=A0A410WT23_9BACL|nr:hypothetical protein PC41400_07425 [Paenibacillus chitinolyticus]
MKGKLSFALFIYRIIVKGHKYTDSSYFLCDFIIKNKTAIIVITIIVKNMIPTGVIKYPIINTFSREVTEPAAQQPCACQ